MIPIAHETATLYMKTTELGLLLLCCTLATSVAAQQSASQVSEGQVQEYKASAANGCREAGIKQGDPEEKVAAFCGCVIETLGKSMSYGDWQQAYFYSRNKQAKEEMQVLAPHMKNLEACRAQE